MADFNSRDALLTTIVSVVLLTSVAVPVMENAWGPLWLHERTWHDSDAMAYAPFLYMFGIAQLLACFCISWLHLLVRRPIGGEQTSQSATPNGIGWVATLCFLAVQSAFLLLAARYAFALSNVRFVLMLIPTLTLIAVEQIARRMRRTGRERVQQ